MRSFKAGYKRAGWGESIIIVWLNDKGRKWRHVPFGLDVPGSWIGIRSFLAILKIYDNFATDSACLDNAIKFVVKIHIKPAYVVESQYPIKKKWLYNGGFNYKIFNSQTHTPFTYYLSIFFSQGQLV